MRAKTYNNQQQKTTADFDLNRLQAYRFCTEGTKQATTGVHQV